MITNVAIGVKMPDGSVLAVRLNRDGYVGYAGAILGGEDKTAEQVEALLVLGKRRCDRYGAPLDCGFTVRRFNTDEFYMKCAEDAHQHLDRQLAANRVELSAGCTGNRDFADPGWLGKHGRNK